MTRILTTSGKVSSLPMILLLAFPSVSEATHIVEGFSFGFQMPGTTLQMTSVPAVPRHGEAFRVIINGKSRQVCPPLNYQVVPLAQPGPGLRINADTKVCETLPNGTEQCDFEGDCEPDSLPLEFTEELQVPAEFWDSISTEAQSLQVTLEVITGQELISNSLPPQLDFTSAIWKRTLDLERGTHVVPPNLGAGYWIIDDRPNEGLLVQQQGDRVVFHELAYGPEQTEHGNFAGTWIYADATFAGDSGNGLALKVARPDSEDLEVVFETTFSSSIIVDDVNHIRTLFDASPREYNDELQSTAWRRWSFNRNAQDRPAVVPDFSGEWTLLRFVGSTELERSTLIFDDGAWVDPTNWRFEALDTAASLICEIDNQGNGHCLLEQDAPAESMRFTIANFNGNVAEGVFLADDGSETDDAVFLRKPFMLPETQ